MSQSKLNPPTYAQEPRPGEVLADKYRLGDIIGRGGFGLVYEATHLDVNRRVALKVLLPEFAHQDPELAIRFRREALLASELRHPNTITLYDYGDTDRGILYMAMEFVEGRTLSAVLRHEAPVTGGQIVHIFRQILASLAEAHSRGIVHRDLKPGNIMLTEHRGDRDFVKVLDFGIAKAVAGHLLDIADVAQTLTQAGRFCGTPRYMAPEQFRSGKVTPSCDLYSLGLIGYELLTAKPAVSGKNMVDVIVAQVTGPDLRIPDEIAIPESLKVCLEKALAKSPAERYKTAEEFMSDLDEVWMSEYAGGNSAELSLSGEMTIDMSSAQLANFAPNTPLGQPPATPPPAASPEPMVLDHKPTSKLPNVTAPGLTSPSKRPDWAAAGGPPPMAERQRSKDPFDDTQPVAELKRPSEVEVDVSSSSQRVAKPNGASTDAPRTRETQPNPKVSESPDNRAHPITPLEQVMRESGPVKLSDAKPGSLVDTEATVEISDYAAFARRITDDDETASQLREQLRRERESGPVQRKDLEKVLANEGPETVEMTLAEQQARGWAPEPQAKKGPSKMLFIIPAILFLLLLLALLLALLVQATGLPDKWLGSANVVEIVDYPT